MGLWMIITGRLLVPLWRLVLLVLVLVQVLRLVELLLLPLHLELRLLLLAVLGDPVLDNVQVTDDVVLGGRQFVGVLQAGLRLQQATTFHVDDA